MNRPSEISLVFAADLALHLGVNEIVLLNLILSVKKQALDANLRDNLFISPQLEKQLNAEILQRHKAILQKQAIEHTNDKVRILPYLEYFKESYSVNDYMRKFEADLLVCGGKERNSFLEIIFGSAAKKKPERINYPMIVLSDEPVPTTIEDIVLAIDLEERNQDAVDPLIEFSRLLNAHLHLLHVKVQSRDVTNEDIEALRSFAKNKNLVDYSINLLSSQSFEDGLENYVSKAKPDMIALVNPGKGKLDKMIFGDKTKATESKTELPVFICETV
ncbi:MAG: hypothetical protein EA361_13910 [Bacteroidetes bacterium]|nr:MAG: hypothetical protein EA361_13910 [Bacteroidota bacterium]